MRGDRFPHPPEDSDHQIPFPRDGKGAKCPRVEWWSFELRHFTDKLNNIKRFKEPKYLSLTVCAALRKRFLHYTQHVHYNTGMRRT